MNELLDHNYFFLEVVFCVSALPAEDLESFDVRPSRSVLDAAVAADEDVAFSGALRCDKALPADDLDAFPVAGLDRVFDALVAAGFEVTSFFAMRISVWGLTPELSRPATR